MRCGCAASNSILCCPSPQAPSSLSAVLSSSRAKKRKGEIQFNNGCCLLDYGTLRSGDIEASDIEATTLRPGDIEARRH